MDDASGSAPLSEALTEIEPLGTSIDKGDSGSKEKAEDGVQNRRGERETLFVRREEEVVRVVKECGSIRVARFLLDLVRGS